MDANRDQIARARERSGSALASRLAEQRSDRRDFARGVVLLIHVLQLAQHAAHFRTPVAACRGRLLGLRELRLKIVPPPITKSFASADTPPCGAKYDESRGPSRALHAYWL